VKSFQGANADALDLIWLSSLGTISPEPYRFFVFFSFLCHIILFQFMAQSGTLG